MIVDSKYIQTSFIYNKQYILATNLLIFQFNLQIIVTFVDETNTF